MICETCIYRMVPALEEPCYDCDLRLGGKASKYKPNPSLIIPENEEEENDPCCGD